MKSMRGCGPATGMLSGINERGSKEQGGAEMPIEKYAVCRGCGAEIVLNAYQAREHASGFSVTLWCPTPQCELRFPLGLTYWPSEIRLRGSHPAGSSEH